MRPQHIEHYNALAPPHGQVISVGVDLVPEVDEVNALPKLTADAKELEVIEEQAVFGCEIYSNV